MEKEKQVKPWQVFLFVVLIAFCMSAESIFDLIIKLFTN